MSQRVTGNTDLNYVPMKGRKKGSKTICSRTWLRNIFLYRKINHLEIEFWVKDTLMARDSRALIALNMC